MNKLGSEPNVVVISVVPTFRVPRGSVQVPRHMRLHSDLKSSLIYMARLYLKKGLNNKSNIIIIIELLKSLTPDF